MATQTILVTVRAPATLVPSPAAITQNNGTTATTTWTVLDASGVELSGYTVTVVSGTPAAVTVGGVTASGGRHTCVASLVGVGTSILTGSITGTAISTTLTVTSQSTITPGVIVALGVAPGSISQNVGSSRNVIFTPLDGLGGPVTGATVATSTSNAPVATVTPVTVSGADHTATVALLTVGSANITGTVTSVTPNVSAVVPVTSTAPSGTAYRSQNFGQYANLQALLNDQYVAATNPNGWWSAKATAGVGGPQASGEWNNVNRMTLETSSPCPQGSSQYLRYTYPTNRATPLCGDYTIGGNVKYPQNFTEVWIDMYTRFSANFNWGTLGTCSGIDPTPPAAGQKYVFGRCNYSRFELIVGTESAGYTFGYPGKETWVSQSQLGLTASQYRDGQWHRWRYHFKVGASGRARFWFDNNLIRDTGTVAVDARATYTYGIGLGRNMNLLPPLAADITLDWGLIEYHITDPGW